MYPLLHGALFNLALLAGPGAQNLYVFQQGVAKNFFKVGLISALCDIILLSVGIFFVSGQLTKNATIFNVLLVMGVLFLVANGIKSIQRARRANVILSPQPSNSAYNVLATVGFSFLNPGVYLDTVGLVGVLGSTYSFPENGMFFLGASVTSSLWFFTLGYIGSVIGGLAKSRKYSIYGNMLAGVLMLLNAGILAARYF